LGLAEDFFIGFDLDLLLVVEEFFLPHFPYRLLLVAQAFFAADLLLAETPLRGLADDLDLDLLLVEVFLGFAVDLDLVDPLALAAIFAGTGFPLAFQAFANALAWAVDMGFFLFGLEDFDLAVDFFLGFTIATFIYKSPKGIILMIVYKQDFPHFLKLWKKNAIFFKKNTLAVVVPIWAQLVTVVYLLPG